MPYCAYCGTAVPAITDEPCPQCGQAISGATSARAVKSSKFGVILGISLAVIAVAGTTVFYAVIMPRFQREMDALPQSMSVTIIQQMAMEIEAHKVSHGSYPASLEELGKAHAADAWGRRLEYLCIAREQPCDGYILASPGADGVFEKPKLTDYSVKVIKDANADLVFRSGSFVQYPEGVAR